MKLVSISLETFLYESKFRREKDPKIFIGIGIAKDIIPLITSDVLEDIDNMNDPHYINQLQNEDPEYLALLNKVKLFLKDKAFFGPYFEPGRESKRKMINYIEKNANGRYVYDGLYGNREGKDGWIVVFSDNGYCMFHPETGELIEDFTGTHEVSPKEFSDWVSILRDKLLNSEFS